MNLDQLKADLLGDYEQKKHLLQYGKRVGDPLPDPQSAETTALTMCGSQRLDEFRDLIERAVRDDVPGDIVETGVWRGGACIWAAAVLDSLRSSKRVYVCDSFEGLPPPTHPKETHDYTGADALKVPQAQVEANFLRFGLHSRAVFIRGWFRDTMPTLNIPVAVLRLDGDMYESTDDVLRHMYPRVSGGGYVIIDDYTLEPCKRAVDEFRSRQRLRGSLPARLGAWWQKPPRYDNNEGI